MQTANITLFKGDDAIIRGSVYEKLSFSALPGSDEKKVTPVLALDFVIRANGKLCEFRLQFDLCEYDERPSLQNWSEWYSAHEVLSAIGYRFINGDMRGDVVFNHDPMREWIDRIFSEIPHEITLPKFRETD